MLGFLLKFVFLFLRVNGINSFPDPLSPEEEKNYFHLASKGDEKAREKLIMHNLRLVAHIVKKYYSTFKEQDDLISIGTIGLIKAIDSFNDEKGAKFATYDEKTKKTMRTKLFNKLQKKLAEIAKIQAEIEELEIDLARI